jgi:6-phosphofructokinase 2
MTRIITLTINPTIDKSSRVDTVASEIKMRCAKPTFDPGGGGINVSRAINHLGGESLAVYTAGGAMGKMLTVLLHEKEVNAHPIRIDDLTRVNLTVFETSSTLQYRFGMPGPHITEAEWKACNRAILDVEPEYLVLSGSLAPGIPHDYYFILAQQARERDIKVIIDTSGEALEACTRAGAYLMKPNLRELELLSGHEFTTEEKQIEVARDLISGGMAEVLVISMGSAGAMMVTMDDAVQMRPPIVPIQSKVGAGDSMVGGIVWALTAGESLRSAVRYGIAAGTAAVMTPGTDLCRREDVMDIYGRIHVLGS